MNTEIGTGLDSDSDGHVAGERAAVAARESLGGDRVDFCQVFCPVDYDYEAVLGGIRSVIGEDAALIGCTTVEGFDGTGVGPGAVAVGLVASDTLQFETGLGRGLRENVSRAVREAVESVPDEVEGYPYRAAITLHDGLAGVGEQLALAAQQKLGPEVTIAGGAATDDFRTDSSYVFCGDEIAEDAVALAHIAAEERPVVAVGHGHEPISDPVTVTESDGGLVAELDGRPAFEVWKDALRERVREEFGVSVDDLDRDGEVVRRIMGEFEFAIDQGDRYKMRWPRIAGEEGDALHFSVDMPEGTVLRVTHGTVEDQVASARGTARTALEKAGQTEMAGGFVYDCACRANVMGAEFETAVEGMAMELNLPFAGFETYGEMCLGPGEFSGFHNATTVVMLLPK